MKTPIESGYRPCACRDCMEIAIGEPGAFCHECEDAGCPGDRECQAAGAYGGEAEPPSERLTAALIRTRCEHAGFFIVTEGTYHPARIIERLLEALRVLAPEAPSLPLVDAWLDAMPDAAANDEAHPYWASADSAPAISEVTAALGRVAPAGFTLALEGEWHRIGFFR